MNRTLLTLLMCLFSAVMLAEGKAETLRYEDFGAVGDGLHNDFKAIYAAHKAANEAGRPVRIEGEGTYYIGVDKGNIPITTSVDFGKARFIIDDTETTKYSNPLFIVKPSREAIQLSGASSLHPGETKLGVKPGVRSLVEVENSHRKIYIRKGRNANNGTSCREILLVDAKGRIDRSTPVHFDYDRITKLTAYPIDEETIVIKGGEFLTKAVKWTPTLPYLNRGISVKRSNVILEGIVHHIEGETLEGGAPYSGFINISHATDVTVRNCVLTPHLIYRFPKNGAPFTRGTYDISVGFSNNVRFLDCSQTIDINDNRYWGLMGTNFCRNTYLEGCVFSRYDNHMGVHNLTIKNCTFGYMSVQTNGFGKLLIEGCEMRRQMFVNLRADYGSSWKGEITIRNCKLTLVNPKSTSAFIINGVNDATHEFGFDCHLPSRLTVDGLIIDDSIMEDNKKYTGPAVFAPYYAKGPLKPVTPPDLVVLKNITVASGKPLRLSDNEALFKDTETRTRKCDFTR